MSLGFEKHLRPRTFVIISFAILIAIGAIASQSFAIPTDEPNMRELAEESYDVVFNHGAWPESLARKYHGALVEFTIASVEHASGLHGIRLLTVLRHFITFLFFVIGVAAFYSLCRRHFRDMRMGLLGAAFLVLSARIFAHAFINSRDIPHLALFTLAMATLLRFLDRKTTVNAVLLGIAVAADIAVRSMGVVLIPLVVAGIVLDAVQCKGKACLAPTTRVMIPALTFIVTCAVLTVALWPLLWSDPLGNFLNAVRFASSFGGGGLYMGQQLTTMPWHYVFVWITITTPLLYTILFSIGCVGIVWELIKSFWRHGRSGAAPLQRTRILMILWFFGPIVPVMLGAGIYNEWRHVFFVYPAFLFVALEGLLVIRKRLRAWLTGNAWLWARGMLILVLALSSAKTAAWMWMNHPLQNLYFSLPARAVQGNFDLDYWGLTSRKALEAITSIDRRPKIALRVTNNIVLINAKTFFPDQILYGTEVDDHADYVIDTSSEQRYAQIFPPDDLLTTIGVDGIRAASIYVGPNLKKKLLPGH